MLFERLLFLGWCLCAVSLLTSPSPVLGQERDVVELVFWQTDVRSGDGAAQGTQAGELLTAIALFEAQHPNIRVRMEDVGWGELLPRLVEATVRGRGLPDITWVGNTQVAELVARGTFVPLSSYFFRWSNDVGRDQTSDLWSKIVFDYFLDGQWWVSPIAVGTRLLYYRTDLLQQAGVPTDAPPTWADLYERAQAVSSQLDGVAGAGLYASLSDVAHYFTPVMAAHGASALTPDGECNLDSAQFRTALSYWTDFYLNGVTPFANGTYSEYDPMFLNGELAYYMQGPWFYNSIVAEGLEDRVGVTPFPGGPSGQFGFLGGEGVAITSQSDHPNEAWEFVRFITDPTLRLTELAHTLQLVPARRSVVSNSPCLDSVFPVYQQTPLRETVLAMDAAIPLQFPVENNVAVPLLESVELYPAWMQRIHRGEVTVDEAPPLMCEWLTERMAVVRLDVIPELDLTSYQIAFYTVCAVFAALALVGLLVCVIFYRNPWIWYASALFCVAIWAAAAVGYGTLLLFVATPNDGICVARLWLAPSVFIVIFGCLFAKQWRVWRLFSRKRVGAPVTNRHVALAVLVTLAPMLLIQVLWTAISTPTAEVQLVKDDAYRYPVCTCSAQWVWLGLTYGYLGLILLAGCVLGVLTRNVATLFNETTKIAFAVYATAIIAVIVVPLVHVLDDLPEAVLILQATGGIGVITIVLLAVFAPKYFAIATRAEIPDLTGFRSQSTINNTTSGGISGKAKANSGNTVSTGTISESTSVP